MAKQKIDFAKMQGKFEKPSKFLKLRQGENRIRIVSEMYQYYVVGKQTSKGFVRQVLEDGVEVAKFLQDVEPKLTFGCVAFDFYDEHFHVLETGSMLGVAIGELIAQKYPDEYKAYDIIVTRTGEKLNTEYTAEYAADSKKMPKGVSKDSAEYRFILSYFEGLK